MCRLSHVVNIYNARENLFVGNKMFDSEFDPLQDLEALKHNQQKMIQHIQEQDKVINDFARNLMELSKALQGLITEQSKLRKRVDNFETK